MLILAIDTSMSTARCVVTKDGEIIAKADIDDKRTHSVKLLPEIECILSQNRLSVSDLDLIGVANGPGSYTGLRIGVVTAKLLGYSHDIPVVGVNTLDYIAASFDRDGIVCPLIDARNTRAYGCLYRNGKRISDTFVRYVSETMEALNEFRGTPLFFCGDGVRNSEIVRIIKEAAPDSAICEDGFIGDSAQIAYLAESIYNKAADTSVFDAANLNVDYMKEWY